MAVTQQRHFWKRIAVTVLLSVCLFFISSYQSRADQLPADSLVALSEIKKDLNEDGIPDLQGEKVTVAGIANIGTGLLHEKYMQIFVQQDGYGLSLYSNSFDEEVNAGDSVVATGVVQQYYGLTEVNVESYEVYSGKQAVPVPVALSDAAKNPSKHEGMLTEGEGIIINKGTRFNGKYITLIPTASPEDSLMVYVSNFHSEYRDFDFDILGIGDEVEVKGVLSLYNPDNASGNFYKLFLRVPDDLTYQGVPNFYMKWGIGGILAILVLVLAGFLLFRKQVGKRTFKIMRSLKQKEVLLQEIHHRVKNNLAIISGLIELQMDTTEDENAREVLRDSQARIQSMAMVHEKLYNSASLSDITMDFYIQELVDAIAKTFQNKEHVTIEYNLADINLTVDKVVPCGLLVNEIVVNAFKHAFNEGRKGILSIQMQEANGEVTLVISDNGPGLPDDFDMEQGSSLGMMLIKTFADQLQADVSIDNNEEGTSFSLTFRK